jgi:hypothetical protein
MNQLPTSSSLKKSSTSNNGSSPPSNFTSSYANGSGRMQVDACNQSLSGAAVTLSVAKFQQQYLDEDVLTQKKPHAVGGMERGQSIRPRGQVVPTFEAAGGNYWFQDHDTLLLEYAYQIVGVPLAERWDFSEQEIKDELKMTFPRPPNSG